MVRKAECSSVQKWLQLILVWAMMISSFSKPFLRDPKISKISLSLSNERKQRGDKTFDLLIAKKALKILSSLYLQIAPRGALFYHLYYPDGSSKNTTSYPKSPLYPCSLLLYAATIASFVSAMDTLWYQKSQYWNQSNNKASNPWITLVCG